MIRATSIADLSGRLGPSCVTVGNFDGVHIGHQRLLERVRNRSLAMGLAPVAVTFDPHPRQVLARNAPEPLTPTAEKLELFAELGMAATLVLPFTRELAAMEPSDFVKAVLVDGLRTRELVVGYDWAFGKGRKGDFDFLCRMGRKLGYACEQMAAVMVDDAVVSSTRIRDLLAAGHVWDASKLLGRYHEVRGVVVKGFGRGSSRLGFPTANVSSKGVLLPGRGVYATIAAFKGKTYPSVANLGLNPTFGDIEKPSLEVHLLDAKLDMLGSPISVRFVQHIREEQRFASVEELSRRIGMDIKLAHEIFEATGDI